MVNEGNQWSAVEQLGLICFKHKCTHIVMTGICCYVTLLVESHAVRFSLLHTQSLFKLIKLHTPSKNPYFIQN